MTKEIWDKEKGCFKQPVQITHRVRRGVLVEIPAEWRGHVPHKQTMRKRKSKRK